MCKQSRLESECQSSSEAGEPEHHPNVRETITPPAPQAAGICVRLWLAVYSGMRTGSPAARGRAAFLLVRSRVSDLRCQFDRTTWREK
ncbi:hypothetical protein AGIG_G7905 [Arapaima gigas]